MAKNLTNIHDCSIENAIFQQEGSPIHIFEKKAGPELKCFPHEIHSPVNTFKGRSNQLKELYSKLSEKQIVAVSGRGGVGKSELAKKYAMENKSVYQKNMFWINAESDDEISKTFKALFKTFYKYDHSIDHLDLMCIINNVYRFFESATLITFDNAIDQQSIFQYLPKEENKNIYTIITTQCEQWKDIKVIKLSGVTENEAIDIFKEIMKEKYNEERDEVQWKNLARQVGYLPLAIQIAAAYIYEESDEFNSGFTVNEYMKKFNENAKILCESLAITFELTLKKINRSNTSEKRASDIIHILNLCAYLDPYYITQDVLLKFFKNRENTNLIEYLRAFARYSLISSDGTNIYIHREIQHILQYRQQENGDNKYYFFLLLKLLIIDKVMFYHCRYAMQYAEKHVDLAVEYYKETKSSKYLIILTQYGCHKTLTEIFETMCCCCGCCCFTPYSIIKKHVLLCEAVLSRNVETVELMLKYSKRVNVKNKHGWTPLRTAVECKCFEIQNLLIENGASNEKTKDGVTQLHECLRDGHLRLAHFLIEIPTIVNMCDDNGNTPLHYAATNPKLFENDTFIRVLRILVDRVENIDAVNKFMCTPLHLTVDYENFRLAQMLIDANANICLQNKNGNTPLMKAVIKNDKQLVMYICQNDLNDECIVLKNHKGWTAIHIAIREGFEDIAMYLAEKKNDITIIKDKIGNTAIHLAVIFKHDKILLKLLNATYGNINILNNKGLTPLKLAENLKNKEAIAYIEDYIQRYNSTMQLQLYVDEPIVHAAN